MKTPLQLNCKLHDIVMLLHRESDSSDHLGVGVFARKQMSLKNLAVFCFTVFGSLIFPSGCLKKLILDLVSYENEFEFHENEPVLVTHVHVNGFT